MSPECRRRCEKKEVFFPPYGDLKLIAGGVIAEIGFVLIAASDLDEFPEVIPVGIGGIVLGAAIAGTSIFSFLNLKKHGKRFIYHRNMVRKQLYSNSP